MHTKIMIRIKIYKLYLNLRKVNCLFEPYHEQITSECLPPNQQKHLYMVI